ncbi:hypothetical protein GJ496_010787 [Pomphorhynchus laevis]|nr:hypothetical protein GJ496_010787 [Pomphorhynchus laevis]
MVNEQPACCEWLSLTATFISGGPSKVKPALLQVADLCKAELTCLVTKHCLRADVVLKSETWMLNPRSIKH